jgi:hypothetical protein
MAVKIRLEGKRGVNNYLKIYIFIVPLFMIPVHFNAGITLLVK